MAKDNEGYKFLFDRDASKSSGLFPAKRVWTLAKVGIPEDADDSEIVRKAWDHRCTIVTSNGEDFRQEILRFQSQTKKKDCHELYGLVVLPSGYEHQRRTLSVLQRRLLFGSRRLSWSDVWEENYYVKVKRNGSPEIKRFPRCLYCQKLEVKGTHLKPELF
jgi:hypothetical protein